MKARYFLENSFYLLITTVLSINYYTLNLINISAYNTI